MNKKKPFQWDEVKEKATIALAKGDFSQEHISSELGISLSTLRRWLKIHEFQHKVDEIIADIDVAMKTERIKIAKKEIKRVVKRLESNEDKPSSRDLVALLKYVGEETGDYTEAEKTIKIIIEKPEQSDEHERQ